MNDTDLPFYDTARPPFDREPPSYAVHGRAWPACPSRKEGPPAATRRTFKEVRTHRGLQRARFGL
jgi:hypothetical protein